MKMTKTQSERLHAKKRALERYGINLTKAVRNELKTKIRNNKGRFLFRQSRRITIWSVPYNNENLKVVYDTLRGEIVTLLPKETETDGHEADAMVEGL